jgi:predicted ferric reductase
MLIGGLLAARLVRHPDSVRRAVGWHRHAAALGLAVTGVHLGGLIADSFVDFSVLDLFVPFASDCRPGAVAWGILALDVMIVVEVTSLLHRRLSKRTWRLIHRLSAVGFAAATIHLLNAGSEAQSPAVRFPAMAVVALLTFLYLGRPLGLFGRQRPTPEPATAHAEAAWPAAVSSGSASNVADSKADLTSTTRSVG